MVHWKTINAVSISEWVIISEMPNMRVAMSYTSGSAHHATPFQFRGATYMEAGLKIWPYVVRTPTRIILQGCKVVSICPQKRFLTWFRRVLYRFLDVSPVQRRGRYMVSLAEHVRYRPSEKLGCKIWSPLEHILIFFRVVLSTWIVDDDATSTSSKYGKTKSRPLTVSSMNRWNVCAAFRNPNTIYLNSNKPKCVITAVFATSPGLTGIWWYAFLQSITENTVLPSSSLVKFCICRTG